MTVTEDTRPDLFRYTPGNRPIIAKCVLRDQYHHRLERSRRILVGDELGDADQWFEQRSWRQYDGQGGDQDGRLAAGSVGE